MRSGWASAMILGWVGIIIGTGGCHKRVPAPASALPPAPAASSVALDDADSAFNSGNYARAVQRYSDYLGLAFSGDQRDRTLFQLGLIYTLPEYPPHDWQRASAYLKQAGGTFKSAAQLILSLHEQVDQLTLGSQQRDQRIKELTTELDRLKKIDADRLKRP